VPYYEGEPVPLTWPLTDADGNPVQAQSTPPVLTVTQPDGTTDTPSSGYVGSQYMALGPSAQAGHYEVLWVCADATYPGSYTDSYDVQPQGETSILSLAEGKRTLRLSPSDPTEDDFVIEFSRAATDIVEWYCGPVIQQAVTERLPAGGLVIQLSKPPVLGLTAWTTSPAGLAGAGIAVPDPPSPMFPTRVFGVSYPTGQLYADPVLGTVTHTSGLPFYYGEYIWSYQAGRLMIPQCITYGARALLRHLYGMERGGQGGGSQAASSEDMTETPMGFAVPNRVLEILSPEKLPAAIA
jgi:hypothetical protein